MHPNNPLHTEKLGGHYTSFVAMFYSLHSVTNKKQHNELLYSESRLLGKHKRKAWQSQWEIISRYHKLTPYVVGENYV